MMLFILTAFVVPQTTWAADEELETTIIEGKTFNILRSESDWLKFRDLVNSAKANTEVNAIMDADIKIHNSVALGDNTYYHGTFDGNGHTLELEITGTADNIAPFCKAKECTFRNLRITGKIQGKLHTAGLIGHVEGDPEIHIERVRISANITSTSDHAGGFIGHSDFAEVYISDCLFDGVLTTNVMNGSYGGSFCGWGHNAHFYFHRLYENATYSRIAHAGFCYWYNKNGDTNTYPWGSNSNSTNCLSSHAWGEMANASCRNVTDQNSVVTTMNKEKAGTWELVGGKAVPVMNNYLKSEGVTLEFFDIIPGAESGDEGILTIPVSSDKIIKWIEASYTDEDGHVKNLGRTELEKNSYFGYVKLPATEAHRNLTITTKLIIDQVTKTYDAKKDAVLHNPRQLKADMMEYGGNKPTSGTQQPAATRQLTDAGAVLLKWTTKDMDFTDILESDPFVVQRSLTGKSEDFEDIGSVSFESKESTYEYKDSLLIKALTPELIDKKLGIPLVRYRVFRSSTSQLWGMDKNPTVSYVQPQIATLMLLMPSGTTAKWSNQTERKVKVNWSYFTNNYSTNYVWDSRAKMMLEVKAIRLDGTTADSTVTVLTPEQIAAGEMEITLNRSCVKYKMQLIVDADKSPIGKGEGDIYVEIKNVSDWNTFISRINKGASNQNAILTDNVVLDGKAALVTAEDKPFRGILNGNGYSIDMQYNYGNSRVAPLRYIDNGAAITHLTIEGSTASDNDYYSALATDIISGKVFVENCRVSATINSKSVHSYVSSFICNMKSPSSLYMSNCLFDGSIAWANPYNTNNKTQDIGGFVSTHPAGAYAQLDNCYFAPQTIDVSPGQEGCYTFVRHTGPESEYHLRTILRDCRYKTPLGVVQGYGSGTVPPNNWCWQSNGRPVAEKKAFRTPESGYEQMVMLPEGEFYYENLGRIDKTSLVVQTQQSSVVLSWKNVDDEPVDYYEIWRRDTLMKDSVCIATQLIDMVYEDKTVSPVHGYMYFVRGVNSCEGIKFEDTEWRSGNCINTGTVEGYLRFADGTGIPDMPIYITAPDNSITEIATTDESGFFRKAGLPYINGTETSYTAKPNINGYEDSKFVTFKTSAGGNFVSDIDFVVTNGVKFSGFVQFEGTSIPVQGVSFLVNGREVRNSAGTVTSDSEGRFSFRLLEGDYSIQAVKDGHNFWQKGYYHEDEDTTKMKYHLAVDKAGVYFYDQTRVKLIGRIAGGKDQGAIPLGNSLSRNNLGDDLEMVFTLEGDKASRLVWDIQNPKNTELDEEFIHNAKDNAHQYKTQVHTTLNRKVVKPDKYTGEYEIMLPPVKWKIQQITARGYATLFQDGQTGDVIDLTDSLTEHKDEYKGIWKNANGDDVTSVEVKYHAQYNRIYHSPVIIDYKQVAYDKFSYFGDRYYNAKNLAGESEQVPLCYPVTKKVKDSAGKEKEITETVYSFGYPVFDIERSYPIKISATEKYYYNNNTKSDTIDVVRLSGGEVTIHNGFESSTHREVVKLDSVGEYTYNLKAKQVPYLLTGKNALRTLTMTLAMDGTHYEAKPLNAYILNIYALAGAKDVLSFTKPQLIDILRDPPGGGSSAKLSKGSTLKYTYTLDWSYKGGFEFHWSFGAKQSMFTGTCVGVGTAFMTGFIQGADSGSPLDIGIVFSGKGKKGWSYTMTTTEDISTSADKTMVGADGDVYIGTVTNVVMKPAVAIRALPNNMYKTLKGQMAAGKLVVISEGIDEKGDSLFLVRDEVAAYGPKSVSTFVHSQKYIVDQIIPSLANHCASQLFFGSEAEARIKAKQTGQPVYMSLLQPGEEGFGLMNNTKADGTGDYIYNSTAKRDSRAKSYLIVLPDDSKDERVDSIKVFSESMLEWMKLIAQNESEKLSATEKVKNFEIDGGSGMTYSESFKSEVSINEEFKSPFESSSSLQILGSLAKYITKIIGKAFGGSGGTKIEAERADNETGMTFTTTWGFMNTSFKFVPVMEFNIDRTNGMSKTVDRKESFTISMDKRSHLDFDVYRVASKVSDVAADGNGFLDVFVNRNYDNVTEQTLEEVEQLDKCLITLDVNSKDLKSYKGFVYRTRGGATCRPYEGERTTRFYNEGTILDERTRKIENPIIKMDKQSISGVPFGEPARFKIYLANESEVPEATYPFYDLYFVATSNPKGAKVFMDGLPLSGNPTTVMINVGQVTQKTIEVYASEDFDYENLKLRIQSQSDAKTFQEVEFDVHYQQTAGSVAITTPGDKWIMNTDAPYEEGKGWYLPVIISGFNKNQHNFDHIEFQYKENTRGDDYWTNLCGYYCDSTLYAAAAGTKAYIPENGNIVTRFFGDGKVMEKAYDLRAVLFCRNGNSFLRSSSAVLTGVKDTRRPMLFGAPEPKDNILGTGENIVFNFSEDIEYNYLQATTNFEVKGETNETAISEEPSLLFQNKAYAQSEAYRNFADKSVTIEVMIKPEDKNVSMPIFSHGRDGKQLQLWLTENKCLRAVIDNKVYDSKRPITFNSFQRVAMVLDYEHQKLSLISDKLDAEFDNVRYSGYGPLVFGSTNQSDIEARSFYQGRMLQGRVWNRAMNINLLNTYGNQRLTGYEMGLTDYYPMSDGEGNYAIDEALGAHLTLYGATWTQPRGMSLYLNKEENREVKGLQIRPDFLSRTAEEDYTLMFWFRTDNDGHGTLLSNGSGRATDVDAWQKFFIGFEDDTLKYRSNGREYVLGNSFSDNKWHHYAMTVSRAHQVASIFIDKSLKAQFPTDSLGGMSGNFYLGNMVWYEEGVNNDVMHQKNPLTGYIDGLALFKQALPQTLINHYATKALGGREKGLITYMSFDRQERQKNGELVLKPYAWNQVVLVDNGKEVERQDSVFVDSVKSIESRINQTIGAPVQAYQELRNLNFSYVGRDNQLLVNIDELDSRINKRMLHVTVSDIPDMNGNYMKSPATMAVFVDLNPLRWSRKVYKTNMWCNPENDYEFSVNVINDSGAAHTFTVENLPKWLSVNTMTDIIDPKSEQTLTFSINKDTNVGSYDDIIYLTDENGLSEPLVLDITVEGKKPEWKVDDYMKQFSMNIVAQVRIDEDIVTDSRDLVGVFDENNNCMGITNINYEPLSGEALAYITVYDSVARPHEMYFKLWHYQTGKTMALETEESVSFKSNGTIGTPKKPLLLRANEVYIQSLDLAKGWNWVSFNIKSESYGGVEPLLRNCLGMEGDIISDPTKTQALTFRGGQWISNTGEAPTAFVINTSNSYRIKSGRTVKVELTGSYLKEPEDRYIVVKHGWNSIGYTPMVNLPVKTALADYLDEAEDGDVVKSKTQFAMFTTGANGDREWKGNLKYMKPGEGYMLSRKRRNTVRYCYPFFEPNASYFEVSSNRAPAMEDNADNMTLTAVAEGIELQEGDKLIAYSSAEIRGESVASDEDAAKSPVFYMTIAGNKKAPLSFAIERDGDIVATTGDVLTYETNAVSGTPEMPTKISFVRIDQLPQHGWYTVQGIKLDKRPTQSGVYIHNGKKTIVK